jgi:hypothetical protein
LAFKLYQDGVEIAEVPYEGQEVTDWVTYVINPIDPGTYLYDVSAIYDLTVFGFPGEIGESGWEGTDTVHVVWGFPIPFFEGWEQGTFDFNTWTTSSSNWSINPVVGTPEPSAEFSWDPLLENDYSSTLTSNPLNADLMTEGDMWLDFDVKLDDRNSTGLEMLNAEVYNGSTWSVVATFANNGSFDWTSNHVDVSAYAMTNAFRIRFNAVGMNSFDVVSWFIDNISVYRTCQSISDLTGEEYNLEDVLLTWNAPVEPVVAEWLYYDDATIEYVWGSTSAWSSDEAIRFEPSQLVDFAGAAVTKISVFIDSRLVGVGTVSAKIWQGANASTLIYEEDCDRRRLQRSNSGIPGHVRQYAGTVDWSEHGWTGRHLRSRYYYRYGQLEPECRFDEQWFRMGTHSGLWYFKPCLVAQGLCNDSLPERSFRQLY